MKQKEKILERIYVWKKHNDDEHYYAQFCYNFGMSEVKTITKQELKKLKQDKSIRVEEE